jgi:RNA polymerase sigma-70 factor (ECF subfamily)
MTEREPSDAELVEAARREPAAFDGLYRRYLGPVYRYAMARCTSASEAEDITSAVFVEALTGLHSYREQGRFAAWLFTIARRQVTAHHRRAGRTAPVESLTPSLPKESLYEERELVAAALDRLPEEAREALVLRFFADLKIREVAAVLGKRESATKMLIHRSLHELREVLSRD